MRTSAPRRTSANRFPVTRLEPVVTVEGLMATSDCQGDPSLEVGLMPHTQRRFYDYRVLAVSDDYPNPALTCRAWSDVSSLGVRSLYHQLSSMRSPPGGQAPVTSVTSRYGP